MVSLRFSHAGCISRALHAIAVKNLRRERPLSIPATPKPARPMGNLALDLLVFKDIEWRPRLVVSPDLQLLSGAPFLDDAHRITAHGNRPVSRRGDSLKHLRHRGRPLGVAACAVLYHGPAFREPPQHGKHPLRDDFLERCIAGRHSLCLHDGGSYFGRPERP
jgi:hypothetical protein